ncbi:MAG: Ig-like domain-containing protein, partial [Terracidiphilus sp.]
MIPYHAAQNITLNVQIVGLNTHFCDNVTTACAAGVNPSVVQFGPEITVNNVSVQDNTHLTANITTSFTFEGTPTATTPGYQTVYVNTGSEQVLGGFSVDAPASPTLVSVVPSSTPQGSTVDVTITGSLTNWVQGTTEAILGAGVTVANLTITSPTTATATLSVSPTAPVGGNSVTMITGSEVVGGVGFSVTPSNAYIQSVGPLCQAPANDNNIAGFNTICGGTATGTPYVVSQLQTTTLNVVGVGTHWIVSDPTCGNSCGTSFSFGGGVVIDALNVTSATTATVQITVLSNSPVGFVSLTAITGGETVTLQQAIDIEEGFPTLLAIAPTSGSQGATITDFQVLGRFTHFCDNVTTACAPGYSPTQLSFSGTPGITASNISVTDNDTLTATINIAPTAYVDYSYPCGHVLTVETSANEEVSTAPILDNFCVTQGPAQINSVSLPAIPAGNTGTITITGSSTHFQQGVTTVSFGDPNLSVPNGDVTVTDATHLTATIAASTSATPGTKTVTVSTFGEVASEQFAFSVLPDQPVLTESNPYQAEQGQQLYLDPPQPGINVVLTGQYTHFSNLSTATFGPGIVVNSVTWQSTTQVTANITIDPLSYTGGRTVTVTTPGVPCSQQPVNITYVGCSPGQQTGTGSEVVSASIFQIIPGPAIISNVTPNTGNEGQEVVFNITGTSTHWQQNFTQFYIAGGGSDLTVNSVIINSPTSATVDMNISPTANPGARSIYMSTAGESLTDGGAFVVTGGVPAIAYISPNSAAQGAGPVEVTIHGIYTLWTSSGAGNSCLSPQAPASTTLNFGPGVTVVSCQVDDNFNIEAVLSVSANATLGYNVFSVVTGTQVLTGNFLVTAPPGTTQPTPFIWQETPSTGLPGQTLNVYFSGLYTSWNPSSNLSVGTCMSAGTGIQVNTFQVTGLGSALANITITATGSQTNQIVFSTPCQGSASPETETADFNVVVAQPVLSVVDPGSAVQGATNVTVNILGQFTAFDSTTTFSFGPNITVVGSPTILGPTVATQVISIPQLAQTGGNAVVATTPDAPPIAQVVSGASFSITPSLASILAITPNVAQQGVTGFIVEVTGQDTHWDGATIFQFGDGITVTNTEVNSETDATITLSVPAYASEGPTYVSATTGGEVASISNGFVVSAGTPYLLSSGPGSLPQQGSATFTILAQQTGWSAATPPVVSYGTGVNISAVNVTSPQSLTVTGSIQATTPVGYRNLTVTNGTQVLTLSNVLYVSPGPAVINSISPNTGGQGVNLPTVQIHGTNTNWAQGVTTLTFPGALVNSFTVNGPTLITANITVSAYAPAGQVSVTATTLGEVATGVNVFTVTQTQPELLAVVPSSAPQGWTTQNVTLTGDFTHFCDNVTTTCPAGYAPSVANFGAGILVNSVTANGFGSLVANVTVEPTASLGYRTVSVVTGAEAVQIVNAFDVITGPAAIASLSPASGKQNTSLTVLVTGSQTHFCDNVAVVCQNGSPITAASFGGGIQVTGISAVDASHANVNITIPSTTALGQYNVTLTTGGEVATILGGFQVLSGTPALTQVNPATGTQGTSENITITGLFTHFCDNVATACGTGFTPSTVTFGTGITVSNIVAVSNTELTAKLTISQTAAIQSYTPTVMTGAENASETGGFSVLAGVPALLTASPSSAQAGATTNVVITGQFTTFQAAFSTVSFGSGVTVNFITSVTPTQLTANITVATNAAVGSRTVTVTTNSQVVSLSNAFNVTAGTPVITEINPNIGNPGQNLTVTLTGQYTNWSSSTLVTIGGASSGISVGGATPGTPGPVVAASATATSITVNLTIAAGAPLGPADVVTSEGENVPAGFTVQAATVPAPSVAMLSPGPYYYSGDMPINSSIVAVFSQPMLRSTINTSTVLLQLSASNGQQSSPYIQGTVTLDATGRVLTFTPNSLLPVNSTFYFNLTGSIQDAAGVALPNFGNYLYTTFSADSTPPGVIAANPPANATNIGTNVIPQLEFSVPMNQSTSAGMTVSSSGGTVAGTYTWNSAVNCNCGEGNILTFTPTSPLTPNTVYTVSYTSALTDTAGNALVPGSFTFTTVAGSDTVTNTSGSDFTSVNLGSTNTAPSGLLNAPTNFAPRMNYSKPVNPIDINTSTLLLYNNDSGKYIPGTVTVAPNGLSAQFTPSVALLPNTYYRFYQAGGSYDADGNTLNGVNDYFTTGTSSDTTAPTVLSISPANNATSVPLNAEVIVHFSTPIDPDTVSNSVTVTPSGGSPASESCSLASDQVTLMCAASTGLQPATVYSVQVSGFYDVAGNLGTTFNSSFTTASSPLVINVSTGLNAGGSLITTNNTPDAHWIVTLTGTSASGPTSDEAIGLLAATTTSTPPCVQSGGVCSTQPLLVVGQGDTGFYSSWSADGPTSDWINIYPNSTTGSTFGVYSTTFNIPGPTVPANLCLVGAMGIDDNGKLALNGTIITGNYNDTYNLSATAAQVNVPISSDLVVGTNTLSLVWGSTDNSYEAFRLQGTIATCGSTYAGGLTIVSATPTSGSSSVSTATNIKFTFNHSLDPATVNATTLPVMIGWNSNQEIEGTYVLSTTTLPNDTVTFTPDSPFPTSTTIYVGNCYGPYDLAGETLYSGCYTDQFYYFTTGATATAAGSPFQVVAFSPANNATNVGLRTPIAATFNRSIDLNSVNSNDYTLWEGDGTNPAAEPPQNGPWCSGGSYTHSQDDTTIIFNCGILPSSSTMTAELSSGLTDWQGNPLTPAYASTFTTSYYDSNTNGTIVSYAPGNGASGVADNLPLVLYGNLPFNSTNPAAGIEVAQNGTPLPGSVQVIDNGYTLVFTPSATLQPGALIQWWTNSALTDTTYSTPFNTASGYFFVAASTATLTPTVETMSPTNGSANIPLNSFFDVQFNTPLNASTVIPANVFLYDSTTGLHPSVNMSQPEPNVVRLVPTSALPVNHYIYLNVTANLQSTTSVPASVCTNCKYVYTGTTTDSTLPTIVSSVPFNGATDVGINVDPGVVISKTVDPVSVTSTTFTVSNGGTPLAGSFFFNNTNTRIQFEPNTALPANTVLTMTLNGVLDTVGNSINFTSSFTTGNGPDYTRPSVVSTSVSNSATVPVNPSISIQFSESMDVTTFSTYNGSGSCGDVYIYDTLLGACVPATLSSSSDQSIFYLVPTSPLAAGRTYYLYVNTGDDLAGNELNGFSTTFYADLSASPATTVLAFNPSNGATGVGTNAIIEAEFSAPIDPTTLSGVTLTHGGSTIATTTVLQSGDTVVQLVPTIPLAANTVYSINVTGVKDTTEAAVPAASSTFTTGATFDTSALAIVTVSPATNSTVETNVTPQIEYNKPLNPTTVNNNTFRLYTTNPNTEIPITVTLSANLKVVTLTPVYPLESGTEYQFSGGWGNGPQDEDGNYLNAGWYYFYTSTGTDTHPPTVTVSPANDATGIPLNAQVIALVSAQVDPTTVGQNAIKVSTGGNPIAGTVTLVNNQQINFAPSSPLVAGDVYTVSVGNFTDVNGNSVTPSNTSFTAGTAATTPGLSLVQSDDNPAYGATGVSPSTTITLQFTQNLDPATVNTSTLEVMNTWNSNQGLPGTWVVNPAQPNQVTFTPAEPFPYGAQIYVGECGGPTDVLGEVFYNGSCWQQYLDVFTIVSGTQGTQGTQPLTVMSVSPANGATNVLTNAPVSVTFNNPVTYSSWDSAPNNILLYAGQGSPRTGGNITISADGRTLTFNGGVLNSGTTYTLDLPAGGITDEYGSSLTSIYTSTFTTASTEYGQGNGSITSTNPTNTTGVPTDNLLTLYVNRPVNPSTLAGNLVVTVNGSVYPGTVTAQAGGYEVQYTPNTPFPNSATVQWWFSNVEDVNGDLINSDNGYFYTAAAPVASGVPQVVALSPVEGASNVPANAEFDIEYNIPLLASTVNSTNVRVYDGNTGYLPTSAYTVTQPEPNIIRVQANPGPWTLNTEFYTCVESGVTSTATPPVPVTGNCWTDYFDPTLNSDTTPGTLTIGPPNGTSNVGTNAYFLVSFSKPFDQATFNSTNVQVTTGGNPVAGSWSYSTSNGITGEYFYPVNPLNASTTYQVSVSGILDYAGNAFNSATSTFTTGAAPDFTTPGITLDFPSNQTGVSTTASFTCHYSEAMDPATITSSNTYVFSDVTNSAVPAIITLSGDLMSATITPNSPLPANSEFYYQCYYATDLTGNGQSNAYAYFYTGSGPTTTGPQLVYANPPSGYTNVPLNSNQGPWNSTSLDLLFNEPVATESLSKITLTPTNPAGSALPIGVYAQDGNYIASIALPYALQPNTTYTFNFAGVTDYNGNPASGTTTSSFTTGSSFDFTNPVTSSEVPVNGTGNTGAPFFPVNGQPSITFSEAINPVTVNPSNVYLRLHNNTSVTVPATVSISADYKTVTVTPTAPLQPSTIYDLLYYPNNFYLYDIAGNYDGNYAVFSTFT